MSFGPMNFYIVAQEGIVVVILFLYYTQAFSDARKQLYVNALLFICRELLKYVGHLNNNEMERHALR